MIEVEVRLFAYLEKEGGEKAADEISRGYHYIPSNRSFRYR